MINSMCMYIRMNCWDCEYSRGFCTYFFIIMFCYLFTCIQATLIQLCSDNNLQWIEDPTNALPIYKRNRIRLELQKQPADIHEGVMDIIGTLGKARKKMNKERNAVY